MAAFNTTRFLSPFPGALAAGLVWLAASVPAFAQSTPAITPGTRIFRATMILEANLRQQEAQAQHDTVVAPRVHQAIARHAAQAASASLQWLPLTIVISTPPVSPLEAPRATEYARIRGPEGAVRRFPLARGQDTIQPHSIVVRAGEPVTLVITAAAPAEAPARH